MRKRKGQCDRCRAALLLSAQPAFRRRLPLRARPGRSPWSPGAEQPGSGV